MRKYIQIVLIALMMMPPVTLVRAEVTADIIEVMKKSDAVVTRPEGVKMQMKQSGATITIKIKEITFGVADKDLDFDITNYPGAVVVRKNER